MEITKEMYEYASARIEELLSLTDDSTPFDNPNMIQLLIYSDVVERYEDVHYPFVPLSAGEVIQGALDLASMTSDQLADQIGVELSQINGFIGNNQKPSQEIALRICQILDIKPIEIMD